MTKSIVLVVGVFPQLSETFIFRKVCALAQAGHTVTVLTRRHGDTSTFGADALPAGVEVHVLPRDSNVHGTELLGAISTASRRAMTHPAATLGLMTRCRVDPATKAWPLLAFYRHLPFLSLAADVIHFEFLGLAAMYPLAGSLLHAPVAVSCRGSDMHLLEQRAPEVRARHIAVLRDADAVHCVSADMARSVAKVRGREAGIWIIRPAVDTDAIAPRDASATSSATKIVAVGRLVWIKGYDYLLAAIAELDRRGLDFHVEIIGDGPLRTSLRYSLMELGIEHRVTFLGARTPSQVLEQLKTADVFVLSSHNEGISNAAIEAMACGIPVVTTDAGGMREAVRDGVDGYVVPVRDVHALAERIALTITDPVRRRAMGAAARAHAIGEFSMRRQVADYERMYAALAREPGTGDVS